MLEGKMKVQSTKMFLVLGLVIGIADVTARAQGLIDDTSVEANVPHAFIVNDKTLPAGKYTVKRLDETQPSVLEIRSADGRTAVVFEAESVQAKQIPNDAELVFNKVGDQYFLSKIWTSDSSFGYQLAKSKEEKAAEGGAIQAEHHSVFGKVFKRTKGAK
jgi:hypothetical protein